MSVEENWNMLVVKTKCLVDIIEEDLRNVDKENIKEKPVYINSIAMVWADERIKELEKELDGLIENII